MNTLAPSFLIGSTSFLQVMRTCIKAWMSSNFGQIPPPTPELSALARLKNCCEHSSAYIFDWIFFILAGNEDIHNISEEFGIWPDRTKDCGLNCPWASGKNLHRLIMEESCEHSSSFIFDWINLILAGNQDMHESLNEFKFRPDTTTNSRVICPCTSEKLLWTLWRLLFWLDLLHFFR